MDFRCVRRLPRHATSKALPVACLASWLYVLSEIRWSLAVSMTSFLARERMERRLAAILAADVADYGLPMGRDEEGPVIQLTALRRKLVEPDNRGVWGQDRQDDR